MSAWDPGDAVVGARTFAVARPPVLWLIAAVGATAAALVLLVVEETAPWILIGWALAGPVAIGLLAVFSRLDALARSKPIYAEQPWIRFGYVVALAFALAVIVFSAVRIAFWAGRQWG